MRIETRFPRHLVEWGGHRTISHASPNSKDCTGKSF